MVTTAYHAQGDDHERPYDQSEWCDLFQLTLVPCLPLARAASLSGWSSWPTGFVSLLAAAFYVGGFACFSFYRDEYYELLGFLSGWSVLFAGWVLYLVGPVVAIPVAVYWWLNGIACSLNDYDTSSCSLAAKEPQWATGAVGCFLVVSILTILLRKELVERVGSKEDRACSAHCFACCVPMCALVNAMQTARTTHTACEQQGDHEITPYTA